MQRVTDFMSGSQSHGALPSSSYRLGVRAAPLHGIYSPAVTAALQAALLRFDQQMPGFLCAEGLLHGVETRTSSPVQIGGAADPGTPGWLPMVVPCCGRLKCSCAVCVVRGEDLQSETMPGLYPCGEGAGYAGGIVSAAVDGSKVGQAILRELNVVSRSLSRT